MGSRRSVEEWRALARVAVGEFVDGEGAFLLPELEAKVAEGNFRNYPKINPHHLSSAVAAMRGSELRLTREPTRGGGRVPVYTKPEPSKSALRVAARKRLLQARYLGWTRASKEWNPAPIPAGLELVVHRSLTAAAPYGYRLIEPLEGEVRRIFGKPVPGGSLDNAAVFTGLDAGGMPMSPVTIVIEAKNLRQWIYSRTQELFQVLDKAVSLQSAYPNSRFVPVLVCRKLHPTATALARQIGAHIIETQTQYVRPIVVNDDDMSRKFGEVRDGLGYNLTPHEGVVDPMVRQFSKVLPSRVEDASERWRLLCQHPDFGNRIAKLRDEKLTPDERHDAHIALYDVVQEVLPERATWGRSASDGAAEI